jgi:hypothetical protein
MPVKELQSELLQVALDDGDSSHVRAGAVSALKHCGDAGVPALIRPLPAGQAGPDPQDDIKGNALDLLWPGHMTSVELFPSLTPTADNYFGAYALFQMALPETLKTADLIPALAWATQLIAQSGHMGGFRAESLADAIMFKTWPVFDNPELTRPFLEHIAVRLRHHGDRCRGTDHDAQKAFLNTLRDDSERRRKFLLALCAGALSKIEVYAYRRVGLLLDSDLEWLLSIGPGGSDPAPGLNVETLCNLIECALVIDNVAARGVCSHRGRDLEKMGARDRRASESTVIDKSREIAAILTAALNRAPAESVAAVRTIMNAKECARPTPRRSRDRLSSSFAIWTAAGTTPCSRTLSLTSCATPPTRRPNTPRSSKPCLRRVSSRPLIMPAAC